MLSSKSSSNTINTINPSTGQVIATYDTASVEDISDKVKNARIALQNWQEKGIAERSEYLRNLDKVLVNKKDEIYGQDLSNEETENRM